MTQPIGSSANTWEGNWHEGKKHGTFKNNFAGNVSTQEFIHGEEKSSCIVM